MVNGWHTDGQTDGRTDGVGSLTYDNLVYGEYKSE